MTKAIFCHGCHDIVSPHPKVKHIRWCSCSQWGVYWEAPTLGHLVVVSLYEEEGRDRAAPDCHVLGIHNGYLRGEHENMAGLNDAGVPVDDTGEKVRRLMQRAHGHLFKERSQPIVRVDPEGPHGNIEVKYHEEVEEEKGGEFVWEAS